MITPIYAPKHTKSLQWKVSNGSTVRKGEVIAYVSKSAADISSSSAAKTPSSTTTKVIVLQANQLQITSPADGFLNYKIKSIDGSLSDENVDIGFIEACDHPVVIGGLCVVCGSSVQQSADESASDNVVNESHSSANNIHSNNNNNGNNNMISYSGAKRQQQLTVGGGVTVSISSKEAENITIQTRTRLHAAHKLSVILDLDHTLVHATCDTRASHLARERKDVRTLALGQTRNMWHYVKLRPHLETFLKEVSKLFEISIYTAGTREYAGLIADCICRFMVDAPDDDEVNHMKNSLMKKEASLKKILNSKKSTEEKEEETKASVDIAENRSQNNTESNKIEQKDTVGKELPPTKKRKIRFAEDQPSLEEERREEINLLKEKIEGVKKSIAEATELRNKVFGSRIVSRCDVGDLGKDVKSLRRVFPCGGSMSAVVDDREDVWANAQDCVSSQRPGEPPSNLLLVRPYHWNEFIGFADVNNKSGDDPTIGSKKPCNEDDESQLLWTTNILQHIHKKYYEKSEDDKVSVPDILQRMKRDVLSHHNVCGTTVVFSGLLPLHVQARANDRNRPRPSFIRYAEDLGASVRSDIGPGVTHLVAARIDTDKAMKAKSLGCYIVGVSWLMECLWSLTYKNEQNHLLMESSKSSTPQPVGKDADEDSSDDELVDDLENELLGED